MSQAVAQDQDLLASGGSQYFTFFMNGEEYGMDILLVQSVQDWERATPVPNTPDFVLGVINVRGDVVPIIDLRRRFDMPKLDFTDRTVVIMVRAEFRDQLRTLGIVVDAVSEVLTFAPADVRGAPDLGKGISSSFVKGLGIEGERMIILLDMEKLVAEGIMAKLVAERG